MEQASNTYFNATADNDSLEDFDDDSDILSDSNDSDEEKVNKEGKIRKLHVEKPVFKRMYTMNV